MDIGSHPIAMGLLVVMAIAAAILLKNLFKQYLVSGEGILDYLFQKPTYEPQDFENPGKPKAAEIFAEGGNADVQFTVPTAEQLEGTVSLAAISADLVDAKIAKADSPPPADDTGKSAAA